MISVAAGRRETVRIYFAASNTALPPTHVDSTRVFMTISAGTRMMSVSRITKSANLPAVIEPIDVSWKPAYAGQIVMLRRASSRDIFCSGNQPPAGQSRAS